MKHQHVFLRIVACALLTSTGVAFAQHQGHGPASPYAGQQTREIKALSPSQTADLLAGRGMEQAKAAELNGYPGPMHVLELAAPLELSAAQIRDSEALLASHKTEARVLGARLVEAERKLDSAFANKRRKQPSTPSCGVTPPCPKPMPPPNIPATSCLPHH